MRIIETNANEYGGRNMQSWIAGRPAPNGFSSIRDDCDTSAYTEFKGFVHLTFDPMGAVDTMTGNAEALAAWESRGPTPDPKPEPEEESSVWDELDAAYTAGYDEGYQEGVNTAYDE